MTEKAFERISVVGLGYIGLPTAAMFAARKVRVIGVDVDKKAVDTINRGEVHFVEPDLDIVVHAAVSEGYLKATTTPEKAEVFILAVPTPFKGENHEADLSYIRAASIAIAPVLEEGNLVILESTSPVGATAQMADWLAEARPDLTFPQTHGEASDIRIAHCPERVLPGRTMQELITNDRVIGGMTPNCSETAIRLYKTFVTGECVLASSPDVAELAKLTENSYRDVNIAFANELSMICSRLGVDVWELIALANRHPRVSILQPGPGVGGHCIAVDPWFIVSSAPQDSKLIKTAREVNNFKPDWVLKQVDIEVSAYLEASNVKDPYSVRIAVYGLTFKPDIDDLRGSPALDIARKIATEYSGALLIVEPNLAELPAGLDEAQLVTFEQAASADIHVMLVDHSDFKGSVKPYGHVVDARGVWRTT